MGKDAETRDFIMFLEKNPKLFGIAKSNLCLSTLKLLSEQGLPISELKRTNQFSYMTESDIETLLNLLCTLKILDKHKMGDKAIYFANKNTKLFLDLYAKTKQEYNIN